MDRVFELSVIKKIRKSDVGQGEIAPQNTLKRLLRWVLDRLKIPEQSRFFCVEAVNFTKIAFDEKAMLA